MRIIERRALQFCRTHQRTFEMRFFQVHFAKSRAIKHRAFEPPAMKVEYAVFPISTFWIIDPERLINVEALQTQRVGRPVSGNPIRVRINCSKRRSGHLIQQRLKKVMIAPVNQDDVELGHHEVLDQVETGETTTHNHHALPLHRRSHLRTLV